jgi:hypothetical protein
MQIPAGETLWRNQGLTKKIFLRPKNKQHAEEIVKTWKEMSDA